MSDSLSSASVTSSRHEGRGGPAVWQIVPARNTAFTGSVAFTYAGFNRSWAPLLTHLVQPRWTLMDRWNGGLRDALRLVLVADDEARAVEATRKEWAAVALTRRLLRSSEEYTGLSSITAAVIYVGFSALLRLIEPPSLDDLERAARAVDRDLRMARDILYALSTSRSYEFDDHSPPHASSPCGVIRFAAPLIPRAPGRTGVPPGPSSMCVLAA